MERKGLAPTQMIAEKNRTPRKVFITHDTAAVDSSISAYATQLLVPHPRQLLPCGTGRTGRVPGLPRRHHAGQGECRGQLLQAPGCCGPSHHAQALQWSQQDPFLRANPQRCELSSGRFLRYDFSKQTQHCQSSSAYSLMSWYWVAQSE